MPTVLIVEDNPDQLEIRRMLVEFEGHTVLTAPSADTALALSAEAPHAAVVDLSIPTVENGLWLIRELKRRSPGTRIAVLTGRREALSGQPEEKLVDAILGKPCPTEVLLATIARLLLCLFVLLPTLAGREFRFEAPVVGEVIAKLDLASPGSDFSLPSRMAAVARLRVDNGIPHHVVVFGERPEAISVFLGPLPAGPHTLTVERDERYSAPDSRLEVHGVKFSESQAESLLRAPVLFARAGSESTLSDLPLLAYYESKPLTYTVIFSNKDGGHSTAGLLARWGRTTDIEYVYRVEPDREIVQGRDHQDIVYAGSYFGRHPLLIPVTLNNMVEPGQGVLRFQLAPDEAQLERHSREVVMDRHPWTYAIAAKELIQERRLTPEIGDPRDYLFVEAKIQTQDSRVAFKVRLTTEPNWRMFHRNDPRLAIERSGWVRAAIRLPPGTGPRQIAEFGFDCLSENEGAKPRCEVTDLSPAFFLTPSYVPGRRFRLPLSP